jgi:PTH1 family peptidyl-tRNA hydrolase
MKIIVGLGNPGLAYSHTRHNIGFMLVDYLAVKCNLELRPSSQLKCSCVKGKLAGVDVVLVKPTTYMNLSGQAVQAVLHWYKIEPSALLVVHDDVSLHFSRLRFQKAGGAGGQHGVESIISCLSGNKGFDRLKLGVGPDPGGATRGDYVLSRFPKEQEELLPDLLQLSATGIEFWLRNGIDSAANKFNSSHLPGENTFK